MNLLIILFFVPARTQNCSYDAIEEDREHANVTCCPEFKGNLSEPLELICYFNVNYVDDKDKSIERAVKLFLRKTFLQQKCGSFLMNHKLNMMNIGPIVDLEIICRVGLNSAPDSLQIWNQILECKSNARNLYIFNFSVLF